MNYAQVNAITEAKSGPSLNQMPPEQGRLKPKIKLHFKLPVWHSSFSYTPLPTSPSCASTGVCVVVHKAKGCFIADHFTWVLAGRGLFGFVWFCRYLIKKLLLVKTTN